MNAAPVSHGSEDSHRAMTVAALMAIYLQAVNISIPNAALPHLQGALSMANDEVGWIFTSYIAAGVVVMPTAGWVADRYGRRFVYLLALACFASGLVMATLATTPLQFVFARVVQGSAGGLMGPLSVVIMLGLLPPARHARFGFLATITVMIGICTGPAIGGWLSEYHGWRSIFYLSLPPTAFIALTVGLSLPATTTKGKAHLDVFGVATFSLGIAGLQMLLDRGERLEWFASGEIWAEASMAFLGFSLFLTHILTADVHFLHKALFRDPNFVLSAIMFFACGFVLLPTLAFTSPMLEEVLNYPVDTTGYMTIPRGVALVGAMVLMRFVPAWIDNRCSALLGMALVAYANWRMLAYSPAMDWAPVAETGLLQGAGLGLVMEALAKEAFSTLDPQFRAEGTALFNLSRLYGAAIGVGVLQLVFYSNFQATHLALAKALTPYRAESRMVGTIAGRGLAALDQTITGQAAMIATIDEFKVLMIVMLVANPLALFLRKPSSAGQIIPQT